MWLEHLKGPWAFGCTQRYPDFPLECSLGLVLFCYLPVAALQVQLGETLSSIESIQHFFDVRKGIGILDGEIVEAPKVYAEPETAILLPD